MKKYILLLCVLMMCLMLAACNTAVEETEENNQDQETQQDNENNQNNEEDDESNTESDSNNDEESEMNDDNNENSDTMQDEDMMDDESNALIDMLKSQNSIEFMVEWKGTTTAMGQAFPVDMTQYAKNGNFRTDSVTQGIESRTFIIDDDVTSCVNVMNAWNCNTLPNYEKSGSDAITDDLTSQDTPDFEIIKKPSRTIAGTTASCYEVNVEGSTVEYCFSSEGVPLYTEMNGEGISSVMEASSYSTTVANSVFDLPN